MKTMPGLILSLLTLTMLSFTSANGGTQPYQTGDNLLKNPTWQNLGTNRIPAEWDRLVLHLNRGQATVEVNEQGELHIVFKSTEWMDQARLRQTIPVTPGKVYELTYSYRSEDCARLWADVAAVDRAGSRNTMTFNPPSPDWVRRRVLFHLPDLPNKDTFIILLQNRSMIPIWYREVALRATDIAPADLPQYQPDFAVHPKTSDDVFIMPDNRMEFAEFIIPQNLLNAIDDLHVVARFYPPQGGSHLSEYANGIIRVPTAHIPTGTSRLITSFFQGQDPESRVMIGHSTLDLERLGPEQIPPDQQFTPNVFVNPDGDPFFPLGMYAGLGWNFSLRELRDAGFNTIHTYGTDSWWVREENFRLLNEAHELGVWIMMGLPPRFMESTEHIPVLKNWVEAYRRYPAILMYYTDETFTIKGVPPATIKTIFEALKEVDPKRQLFSFESPSEELRGCMDGIMLTVSDANFMKIVQLRLGFDMPIFHVFGQADHFALTSPPLTEYQYQFVMPVIHGARGIFYWQLGSITRHNPEGELIRERLFSTASRFAEAAPAIVSSEPAPAWAESIQTTGDVEYLIKISNGNTYVFCGVHRNGQGGQITIPRPPRAEIKDILNAQTLTATGDVLLPMEPGQAFLLRIAE